MAPLEPEFVEQTGLAESTLEQHVLKILYFRGDVYRQDLSNAIGLRFRVTQEIVENLKLRHHIQIKKSLGVGNVASLFSLTETGRTPAREYLESNRYAGPAPVPIEQYVALVPQQRPREGWLTKLKADNGIYLIDDLGRQRATPGEVLEPLDRPDGAAGRLPKLF